MATVTYTARGEGGVRGQKKLNLHPKGMSGFHFRGGGGGAIEPPKTGGTGVREKGSIDRTSNQSL